MRAKLHTLPIVLIMLVFSSVARAQEFSAQRRRDAVRSAKAYVAGLESPGKCPANIEADLERAVGLVIRPQTLPFFLFVPQKALEKTDFGGKEIRKGHGVPVGYVFGHWTPVVGGQLVDGHRMQHTVYQDPKAGGLVFECLVLTVGRKDDGGYVLHAFGTGLEPLFSVPLQKAEKKAGKAAEKAETSLEVKDVDVQGLRLNLELSFGDSRRASIPFGTPRQPGR